MSLYSLMKIVMWVGHETNSEKSTFIHSFILQGDVLGLRGQVGGAAGGRVSASLTSASHFHAARSRRDTHGLSLQLDSASFCPVGTAAGKLLGSSWEAAGEQLVAGEDSGTRIQAVKHFVPVQNAEPELGWAQLSPVTEAASCWQQRVETGGRGEGGPRAGPRPALTCAVQSQS